MSWSSLDKTREEYQKKVEKDEADLADVLARLMRNKKILRQAEERAKHKIAQLEEELEAEGELDKDEDCPAADACVNLSPAVWNSLNFVDMSVNPFLGFSDGTAAEASGSS